MSLIRDIFVASAVVLSLVGCGGGGGDDGGTTSVTSVDSGDQTTLYAVSVSTSGLSGTGLSVNLSFGTESDSLSIASDGVVSFGTQLSDGTPYSVIIAAQPTGQTCTLGSNSSGTITSDEVTVALSCVNDVLTSIGTKVKVDVDTLISPDTVTLTLNGTETKTFSSTLFTVSFSSDLYDGDAYEVTLDTPPIGKICNLYDASGVVSGNTAPLVRLVCAADTTPTYTIGGPVTGVLGSGLQLKLNGSESLSIEAGRTSYAFSTALLSGTDYFVSVETHPTGQICSVQNESAYLSADRADVGVICSTGPHIIGGTITGLDGTGMLLSLNGVEDIAASSSGSFVFPTALSDGMDYAITVKAQPQGQDCTVYRGTGLNITSSQSDTLVACADKRYEVTTSVSPFSASTSLILRLNQSERLEISSSSWTQTRTFNTELLDGALYEVSILAQPSGYYCTLSNPSGIISGTNVTDVAVSCSSVAASSGPYSISVTTSGLLGSGLQLRLNDGAAMGVTTDGYLAFPTLLDDGASYIVDVSAHPDEPLQRCHVESGSGTISGADITNVAVVCENAVASLYPNSGAQWLDYVKNPAVIVDAVADTACEAETDGFAGMEACLNGGEYRVIEADYLTSCDGVSAIDNLNAFNWACESGAGTVRIMSNGLRSGVGLSDLIDFENVAFRRNFVTITSPGAVTSTQNAIWWDNPVRVNNSGEDCCPMLGNDIVLVTDNVPAFYTFANKNALLIQPGFTVSGYTDARQIVSVYDDYYDTNFTWLEGAIDDVTRGTEGGVYLSGNFSVLKDVQVTNAAGSGIRILGNSSSLENVNVSDNDGVGISMWGSNLKADGLTATGNLGTESAIWFDSSGSGMLKNIIASDNPNVSAGLSASSSGNLTIDNVIANNNGGDGVNVGEPSSSGVNPSYIIRSVTARDNGGTGIFAEVIDDGAISDLSAHRNGGGGVHLQMARRTPITNIDASANAGDGVTIFRWEQATVDNISSFDNDGSGVLVDQSSNLIVSDVISSNNGSNGFYVDTLDDSIWANLTTANNAGNGLMVYTNSSSRDPNVFLGVTTVNNAGNGFEGTRFEGFQFSSLLSAYNLGHGLYTHTFVYEHVYADIASANNGGAGIYLGSDRDYFTGLLTLGTNTAGNCVLDTFALDPGLTETGGTDCANALSSDALITQDADLGSSLVGALGTDDLANPDDVSGTAEYAEISAWSVFDHEYRTWGADGSPGRCTVGSACRIWDWSASTADTGNAGTAALWDVLTLPTGNEILSIEWVGGLTTQAECDDTYPGSQLDTDGVGCRSTYLRRAVEIAGDSVGNDNYLCESNESCLFTPNVGSYQGQGGLVAAGTFIPGTLTDITLMRYESNGR